MKTLTEQSKKKARILSLGGMLAVATAAIPASAGNGTYTNHTVTFTGCLANGTCYAGVSPVLTTANTNCATKDQVRWLVSTAGGKEMARNATAAVQSGKTIGIHTLATCRDTYAEVDQVSLNQ